MLPFPPQVYHMVEWHPRSESNATVRVRLEQLVHGSLRCRGLLQCMHTNTSPPPCHEGDYSIRFLVPSFVSFSFSIAHLRNVWACVRTAAVHQSGAEFEPTARDGAGDDGGPLDHAGLTEGDLHKRMVSSPQTEVTVGVMRGQPRYASAH